MPVHITLGVRASDEPACNDSAAEETAKPEEPPKPAGPTKPTATEIAASDAAADAIGEALPDAALSDRVRRFVREYVIDFDGTAAASRAGYTRRCAAQWAAATLCRPAVQAEIGRALAARKAAGGVTRARIAQEVARIAFADPGRIARWGPNGIELLHSDDLTADDRAAVKRISLGEPKGRGVGKRAQLFEMHDKIAALEMLARLMGIDGRGVRGRFATPAELDPEAERRDANAILRERLMRIVRSGEDEAASAVATKDKPDDAA